MSVAFPPTLDRTCETLTGWEPWDEGNTILSLESSNPAFGAGCLRCESRNNSQFQGSSTAEAVTVLPNTQYTASVYVRSPNADAFSLQIQERTAGGGFVVNQPLNLGFLPGDDVWRRYAVTFTTGATTARLGNWRVYNNEAVNTVWFVDGWQLDLGPTALPYDGADVPAEGFGLILGDGVLAGVGSSPEVVPAEGAGFMSGRAVVLGRGAAPGKGPFMSDLPTGLALGVRDTGLMTAGLDTVLSSEERRTELMLDG